MRQEASNELEKATPGDMDAYRHIQSKLVSEIVTAQNITTASERTPKQANKSEFSLKNIRFLLQFSADEDLPASPGGTALGSDSDFPDE